MHTDDLGERMKRYEAATTMLLPRRTYTILRIDGRAFHTLTRNCRRPYDEWLHSVMTHCAAAICEDLQGSQFAYVQSDEISVLLADLAKTTTQAAFDGSVQKLCSISASIAAATFAEWATKLMPGNTAPRYATFDARVFTIPDPVEVENYFIWRQKDCERNSVSGLARKYYSHHKLLAKARTEQQELIRQAGDNWNDWPDAFKRGTVVSPRLTSIVTLRTHGVGPTWVADAAPIFTSLEGRSWLKTYIPPYGYEATKDDAAQESRCAPQKTLSRKS